MHANCVHRISRIPYFHMSGASLLGPGILVLLFLASLAYAVMGGAFALEASPAGEWETLRAGAAIITADADGALSKGNESVHAAQPTDYFHSVYPNRGRDGDGNVTTYEHD